MGLWGLGLGFRVKGLLQGFGVTRFRASGSGLLCQLARCRVSVAVYASVPRLLLFSTS